jgi:hypothetical protein
MGAAPWGLDDVASSKAGITACRSDISEKGDQQGLLLVEVLGVAHDIASVSTLRQVTTLCVESHRSPHVKNLTCLLLQYQ